MATRDEPVMNHQTRFAHLSLALSVALLGPHLLASQTNPRLVPLQRFGWDDLAGPDGRATPAQRRLDGGMLSQVMDLAEGPDGTLYVLDRGGFKVVVFDAKGAVKRIIGNGKGQGPGEFTRPNSLALSDAGELFVLDAGQSRVTVFDTSGKLNRTFPIASPLVSQIRAGGNRLFVSRYIFRGGAPIILVYDANGTLVDKVFPPSEEDVSFGRTGNAYRMARMRDGRIAVGHLNPGTWSFVDDPTRLFGRPLVDKNEVRQSSGSTAWSAPGSLRGLGELKDGRALILFDLQKPETMNTPEHPAWNIFLGIVGPDGTRKEVLDIGEVGRNFLVSRDGSSFYLTVAEPSYQVVRYRLAPR